MTTFIILVILSIVWMFRERATNYISNFIADAVEESDADKLKEEQKVATESGTSGAPVLESTIDRPKLVRPDPLPPVTGLGVIGGFFKMCFKFMGYILVFLISLWTLFTFMPM